ncbi:hypothetical protein GCM10011509_10630 [Ornithinimicrobium pekingense]|uniref:Uncharacterized protein n=1 Tax=Ornithinimicrobium pekingense TaxID=384677 RepID=A0ABQ2F9F9_9MICO|nr:hypothetical protein GCM10011509_10630 [Ornithinimicrobium pekingense]
MNTTEEGVAVDPDRVAEDHVHSRDGTHKILVAVTRVGVLQFTHVPGSATGDSTPTFSSALTLVSAGAEPREDHGTALAPERPATGSLAWQS